MSHRKDRQEVIEALAEFQRGCLAFSRGMARIGIEPADPALSAIIEQLGEPRPARRAQAQAPDAAQARRRASG